MDILIFIIFIATIGTFLLFLPRILKYINANGEKYSAVLKKQETDFKNKISELDQIFNTAADGMRIINKDLIMVKANETFAKMSGYKVEEMIGKKCYEIFPGKTCHSGDCTLSLVLKNNERVELELDKKTKEGKTVSCWVTAVPYLDGKGNLIGILEDFKDVTERKKAAREKERFLEVLKEKNREIEAVLNVTTQDLRIPLVNLLGFSEELENQIKQIKNLLDTVNISEDKKHQFNKFFDEEIKEAMHFIRTSIRKMNKLIKILLNFARLGKTLLNPEELNVNEIISKILGIMHFQIQKHGVTVKVDDLPMCYADRDQINQVFNNLMDNAVKYIEPGRSPTINISGKVESNSVIYCIKDNGMGIPSKHIEKVFDLFHRVKLSSDFKGAGIGLAAVRRIVLQNKGFIWVESKEGEGSSFFIKLPAFSE